MYGKFERFSLTSALFGLEYEYNDPDTCIEKRKEITKKYRPFSIMGDWLNIWIATRFGESRNESTQKNTRKRLPVQLVHSQVRLAFLGHSQSSKQLAEHGAQELRITRTICDVVTQPYIILLFSIDPVIFIK